MFIVLCLLCIGTGAGYLFRRAHSLRKLENTISYTIFAMLFVFGITIGANKTLVDNIWCLFSGGVAGWLRSTGKPVGLLYCI